MNNAKKTAPRKPKPKTPRKNHKRKAPQKPKAKPKPKRRREDDINIEGDYSRDVPWAMGTAAATAMRRVMMVWRANPQR
jgi:hypothetical protein